MVKKKSEGLLALVEDQKLSLEEITLLDFFAIITSIGRTSTPEVVAKESYDIAEAFLEERKAR
tara:strand:+ start:7281 stop:7469 length:189 start_codon:yes stop_codon:yes gene_type:complete